MKDKQRHFHVATAQGWPHGTSQAVAEFPCSAYEASLDRLEISTHGRAEGEQWMDRHPLASH